MNLRLIALTAVLVSLLGLPALAQQSPYDLGVWDSILVTTVAPSVNGDDSTYLFDVYFFNDAQALGGCAMGFKWDNPNMRLVNVALTAEAATAFNFTPYYFFKNNIDSTNSRRMFQLSLARMAGDGWAASATPRKVATFTFRVTDWTATDTICIKDTAYSGGTSLGFSDLSFHTYKPWIDHLVCAGDPDAPQLGTLQTQPTSMSFEGVAGGGNPAIQELLVSEVGGADIIYTASSNAGWLQLTNAEGVTPRAVGVTANITGLTAGTHNANITVTSTEATNTVVVPVTLVLGAPNQPPVLAAIGPQSIDEGQPLSFGVSADDPDEEAVTLTAAPLPAGADFVDNGNGTGTFVWAPTFEQAGQYTVTFTVSDGDLTDTEDVVISVNNVNRAPALADIASQAVAEETNLNFAVTATDPDGTYPDLTAIGLPDGATFVDNENGIGTFDWTPTNTQSGFYMVTFQATDGEFTDTAVVGIEVTDIDGFLIAPNPLDFFAVIGTGNPGDESFTISVSDGSEVGFMLSEDADWFTTDSTTGMTPNDVSVSVDVTGLGAGLYTDTILVSPVLGAEKGLKNLSPDELEPVAVIINLELVEPAKYLTVVPYEFSYTVYQGTASFNDAFTVTEFGDHVIGFTAVPTTGLVTVIDSVGETPTTVNFTVNAEGLAAGDYVDTIVVASEDAVNSPQNVVVRMTVVDCPVLLPASITIARTIFAGETVSIADTVEIIGSDGSELGWAAMPHDYIGITPSAGMTPTWVTITYERMFDVEGVYADSTLITTADYKADCYSQIPVIVNVTVNRPPSADTLIVVNTPAVPGMHVAVPVIFTNSCATSQIGVSLAWPHEDIMLDSVSFVGSAAEGLEYLSAVIFQEAGEVEIEVEAGMGDDPIAIGSLQTLAHLYFTLTCEIENGSYPIVVGSGDTLSQYGNIYFVRNCTGETEVEYPEYIMGNIIVGTASNFVCGYVVDPEMNEIEGATVELWSTFPMETPLMTTVSSGIGSFAFDSIMVNPFDLFAYKEGYYPGLVEDIQFGEKGIMIVLHPVPDFTFTPSSEWVDYFCPTPDDLYFGGLVPVGSVVEAFTQNGLKVGEYTVNVAGQYGFMPVYRGSELFEDDGAEEGDVISFTINGYAAIASGDTEYPAEYAQVQVCLEVRGVIEKECTLFAGWNLVSWNVNTDVDLVSTVLAPIMSNVDVVLGFEQGGLTYDPELPEFSTLWYTDHLSGYWIRINDGVESVTLNLEGLPVPTITPIPVTTGWNLVSYLPEETLGTEEALASIMGDLLVAYGFDTEAGVEIYKPSTPGFNTLTELSTCNGYWVKVANNGTLVYPEYVIEEPVAAPIAAARRTSQTKDAGLRDRGVTTTTNWVNAYSRDLKLDGKVVPAGATITAFAADDDRLVGSFVTTVDGKFGFMAVYADANGEEITGLAAGDEFYLKVNDVPTVQRFEWSGNGNRVEVAYLTTGAASLPTSYSLEQNYPNPFNPSTVISFSLPTAGQARLEVYNILGRLVATPFEGQADAGTTSVEWDGRDAAGNRVASGVYLYRLSADNYTETKKMMLLK